LAKNVGVIILTYNRKAVVKTCLASIQKSDYRDFSIVVIDSASKDGTSDMIITEFPFVKLIRGKNNLGYTGGNNLGIKYAVENDFDYILILNDDTILAPDSISKLVKVIESDPEIGLVNPRIIEYENGEVCNSYGDYNFYLGLGYNSLLYVTNPVNINLLRGTCFLIKKSVFEDIGLMDEEYFLYFDEADLSFRVKKAGYKMFFNPEAIVYHQLRHSFSGKINDKVLYYSTRNELLFAKKHLHFAGFLVFWSFRCVIRAIKYIVSTNSLKSVSAIMDGVTDFAKGKFGEKLN
jgi:GT2 family glycosyltransferase